MPDRHHNAMEPHATLAVWDDDGTLTLYDSTQMVVGTRKLVSLVLGLPEEKSTSCANSSAEDSAGSPGPGRTHCSPRSPPSW
jgi:CO/xanthine dehydrogenase Mo-binding subunit